MSDEFELSERLTQYRADRPDEWTMDEFARWAKKLEQERDSLKAHCERLHMAIIGIRNSCHSAEGALSADFEAVSACLATPAQSLAEIQAKAIKHTASYLSDMDPYEESQSIGWQSACEHAVDHADTLRKAVNLDKG